MECGSLKRVGAWGFKFCTREIVHISLFPWYRIVFESISHPVHSYICVEAMTSTYHRHQGACFHTQTRTCVQSPTLLSTVDEIIFGFRFDFFQCRLSAHGCFGRTSAWF